MSGRHQVLYAAEAGEYGTPERGVTYADHGDALRPGERIGSDVHDHEHSGRVRDQLAGEGLRLVVLLPHRHRVPARVAVPALAKRLRLLGAAPPAPVLQLSGAVEGGALLGRDPPLRHCGGHLVQRRVRVAVVEDLADRIGARLERRVHLAELGLGVQAVRDLRPVGVPGETGERRDRAGQDNRR